jgi:hypothetical protein
LRRRDRRADRRERRRPDGAICLCERDLLSRKQETVRGIVKRVTVRLASYQVVVVSIAVLLATITRLAQAQPAPWSVVASPGIGTLDAVTSISAIDVWAVGVSSTNTTLAEHWNGTAWSVVPSPTVANGTFSGVAAAATNNVWAVGTTVNGTPPVSTRSLTSSGQLRRGWVAA